METKLKPPKRPIIISLAIILLLLVLGLFYYLQARSHQAELSREETAKPQVSTEQPPPPIQQKAESAAPSTTPSPSQPSSDLLSNTSIELPFLSQAPFAEWDPLHEDACEEASLIMVQEKLTGNQSIAAAAGDEEIRKLVDYEIANGYGPSITIKQLAEVASSYYGLQTARTPTGITVLDIKKELAAGRPVIVPAAGKLLPNPNFRNGGPVYHMLVIKGYNSNGFITNDPGTRRGEDFRYQFSDLFGAIHDWSEPNIEAGAKTYLVFD